MDDDEEELLPVSPHTPPITQPPFPVPPVSPRPHKETLTEDTENLSVTGDSYAGINCQYMIANEINQGGTCGEIQRRIDDKLKETDFVTYLPGKKLRLKMCVNDQKMRKNVPVEYDGESGKRYCASCKINVKLSEWNKHISTMYHQVMFKYRALRLSFCWTGFSGRRPHIPSQCEVCLGRLDRNTSSKELLVEDYSRYNAEEDPDMIASMNEEIEVNEMSKKMEKKSTFQCPVCPEKKFYSQEFLDNHLAGAYHRDKLRKLNNKSRAGTKEKSVGEVVSADKTGTKERIVGEVGSQKKKEEV